MLQQGFTVFEYLDDVPMTLVFDSAWVTFGQMLIPCLDGTATGDGSVECVRHIVRHIPAWSKTDDLKHTMVVVAGNRCQFVIALFVSV